MKKMRLVVVMMLVAMLGAGCATYAGLKPGTGIRSVFEGRSKDQIWDASMDALKKNNLWVVEESKENGMIKAQHDASAWSYGEIVGIFISKSQVENRFIVEIQSKKLMVTNFNAPDWEKPLMDQIRKTLNLPIE